MRKLQAGNVQIKMWDIGGQPRFRSMWERYCRGVSAIVFVVDSSIPRPAPPSSATTAEGTASTDSAKQQQQQGSSGQDRDARAAALTTAAGTGSASSRLANIAWHTATEELHALVARPELAGIPLLVLATKNDVRGAASVEEVIRLMRLATLRNREVSCYSV